MKALKNKLQTCVCLLLLLLVSLTSEPLLAEPYSWNDGEQTYTINMLPDMEADFTRGRPSISSKPTTSPSLPSAPNIPDIPGIARSPALAPSSSSSSDVQTAPSRQILPQAPSKISPVFRDSSGTLRALPGGVLVLFHEHLTEQDILNFWSSRGINIDDVTPSPTLKGLYKITTAAGMESLDLSNDLAKYPELEYVSPNWWKEIVTK